MAIRYGRLRQKQPSITVRSSWKGPERLWWYGPLELTGLSRLKSQDFKIPGSKPTYLPIVFGLLKSPELESVFLLYPRAKVTTLIPIVIIPWFVDIPAIIFLGFWFLAQLAPGLLSLGAFGFFGGIAWWAHIGGFLFGLILVNFFARPKRVHREWYPDEYYPW